MLAPSSHAFFDNYALPLTRPRSGSAAALSFLAHAAVATLVLWRGAVWFESRGGGGRDWDRVAVSWVVVPPIAPPHAEPSPKPPPRVTGPTVAPPHADRVNLPWPPRVVTTVPPTALRPSQPDPLPGPIGIDEGQGPSCGGGSKVDTSPSTADGPGDSARDILERPPLLLPMTAAEGPLPPDDQRTHDVQFWIRADGSVTRIVVSPPIRDPEYRRRFTAAMGTFVFGPVQTPDGRAIDYVYNCVVYP